MSLWSCLRAAALALALGALAPGCGDDLTPIVGTTTRSSKPTVEKGTELELRIFTNLDDCVSSVSKDMVDQCLPHVDRASGEVRLGFQFRLDSDEFAIPLSKDNLRVVHQGTEILDGSYGQSYDVIPHDPQRSPQLFVLLIDGSSSMLENNRMESVRQALLLPEVRQAFFPESIKTGVVILTFTDGKPEPLGGTLRVISDEADYVKTVKENLRVLSGYTHLYESIIYATGPLLEDKEVKYYIEAYQAEPTIVALTDGFNNVRREDICRDNAKRLSALLTHLKKMRSGPDVDIRKRPTVFTVGLGRPLRPNFKLPENAGTDVNGATLCSKRFVDRRIDGDLERYGIDNASLSWIAEVGGGFSYVKKNRDGLGEAFRGAAAERFRWFEVRYRLDPFYLRRSFRARLRLMSFAAAEASVMLHPSAWLDAPPGIKGDDGWVVPQTYRHSATVVLPALGLFLALSYLGAATFNVQRAVFRRGRPPAQRPPSGAPPQA